MDELNEKLKLVRKEKDMKVLPENIKKGVSIFDVEGVLEIGPITNAEYNECLELSQQILGEDISL